MEAQSHEIIDGHQQLCVGDSKYIFYIEPEIQQQISKKNLSKSTKCRAHTSIRQNKPKNKTDILSNINFKRKNSERKTINKCKNLQSSQNRNNKQNLNPKRCKSYVKNIASSPRIKKERSCCQALTQSKLLQQLQNKESMKQKKRWQELSSSQKSKVKKTNKNFLKNRSNVDKKDTKRSINEPQQLNNEVEEFQAQKIQDAEQNIQSEIDIQQKKQNNIKLSHDDIRSLFCPHHLFYQQKTDYLRKINQPIQNQQNQQYQNESKDNEEAIIKNFLENSRMATIQNNRSLLNNENSENNKSNFYTFETERAGLLSYLKKSETKKIYTLLTHQNTGVSKFIDNEFPSLDVHEVDGQKIYWAYVSPKPIISLFPTTTPYLLPSSCIKYPIVKFMCCLLFSQREMITRLYEPPINNIFSMWIFLNGAYQPCYIDGYFPLNSQMQHLFANCPDEQLWLPIFMKILCKILGPENCYSSQKINKMKPEIVYQLLTGLKLTTINLKQQQPDQLVTYLNKKMNKKSTCIFYQPKHKICRIVKQIKGRDKIVLFDPSLSTKITTYAYDLIHPKNNENHELNILYIVPNHQNEFIYSNRFFHSALTKFEIQLTKKTQLTFILRSCLQKRDNIFNDQKMRLYIYQCCFSNKNHREITLALRHQMQIFGPSKISLKSGMYKIFFQAGQKRIQEFFESNSHFDPVQARKDQVEYVITLMASNQIKMSQCQNLSRSGDCIQDQQSMYYQAAGSKNISKKQNCINPNFFD